MSELMKFIESNCPKFNKGCQITQADCGITKGRRCLCFEEVLPHPHYAYRPAGFNYDRIETEYLPLAKTRTWFLTRKQYDHWRQHGWGSLFSSKVVIPAKIDGGAVVSESRRCYCGKELYYGQRVCDECKTKRKRETKRRAMQKYRSQTEFKKPIEKRLCGCGKPLRKRRRLCDKCRDHNRKWNNFYHQRKRRDGKMSVVSN